MKTLITGAGGGIGSALAESYARRGHTLVLVDINGVAMERTAEKVRALGADCHSYEVDLTDPEQVAELGDKVARDVGDIDILINNAGVFVGADFVDTPLAEWERLMSINFWGYLHIMRSFLPRMIERGSGQVVNIASGAGVMGMPAMSAYCASKFAVAGMTESVYNEVRDKGVKVSLVCPSYVNTSIITDSPYIGYGKKYARMQQRMSITPEAAAAAIIRGIDKGKFLIFPSLLGRMTYLNRKLSLRMHLESQRILYHILQRFRT